MLQLEGMRRRDHVLEVCRLMVRAESIEHRMSILKILRDTKENACLRLFLDYHGLLLMWSWMVDIPRHAIELKKLVCTITKQPESGDLCGNITEFEVAEGSPDPTPNSVILPYRSPDKGCFVFISYCLMILCHFQLRYMRLICIYYCIYLLNQSVGIHPTVL